MVLRSLLCLALVCLSHGTLGACPYAFGSIYAAPIFAYPTVYPAATLVVPTAPLVAQPVVAPVAPAVAPLAAPAVAAVASPAVAAVVTPSFGYGALGYSAVAAPVVVRQRVAFVAVHGSHRVFARQRAAAVVVRAPAVRIRVR